MNLRRYAAALLHVLLPTVCPGCHLQPGPRLCADCLASVPRLLLPCPWCACPRAEAAESCRKCRNQGLRHIHRINIDCSYSGIVERLVGDAKIASRPSAIAALRDLMPSISAAGVVVPVPPSRGRRPGPHLATALAKTLARRHGLRCMQLLTTKRTAAEQHRLNHGERRRNVADLFSSKPAPGDVILVDDLMTSGATASSAAGALRAAGAKRVHLVCLARTPMSED